MTRDEVVRQVLDAAAAFVIDADYEPASEEGSEVFSVEQDLWEQLRDAVQAYWLAEEE